MSTVNVFLPERLEEHVRERVAAGGFVDAADYLRSLIRADCERSAAEGHLDDLLYEGLTSGEGEEFTPEYMARLRREVLPST